MIKRTVCFQNPAYLSLRDRQLVLRLPEVEKNDTLSEKFKKEAFTTIPIEDIGVIVLDNERITITQGLLAALTEGKCAIVTCNSRHMPIGLQMCLDSNTLQNERFREQLDASEPLRKQMWQQTVIQKIRNQAKVLESVGAKNGNMLEWSKNVRSGDADNLEGRAAAYYWKNLFTGIDGFIRGQEEAPPNNLLNYGYAIVRAIVARSLAVAGLLPTFGIHHHNRYNAYCLADDIMEPYRPYVDMKVVEIVDRGGDYSEMTVNLKRELLGLATVDVNIDGHTSPLSVAAQTTAYSVQKCFEGVSRKIIYPEL